MLMMAAACLLTHCPASFADDTFAADIRATLAVDTNFEGASARIVSIDQQAQTLSFEPGGNTRDGWPCWWNLRVTGIDSGQKLTFRVRACGEVLQTGARKGKTLSLDWSSPERAAYSTDAEKWEQTSPGHRDGEWMTWTLSVKGDTLWIAWGPPYTPRLATEFVQRCAKDFPALCQARVLCQSRQGRDVALLRIAEGDRAAAQRIGIWIHARQHAWESGSSWVAQGLAEWLLGNEPEAAWLRQHAEVFLVPVMDVDHVAAGQGGKEAVPQDHNRDWTDQPHWPEVRAAQQAMLALSQEGRLGVYLDLHNPGPGDKAVHFHVAPDDYVTPAQSAASAQFARVARPHINLVMTLSDKPLNKSGANYDPLWQAMSACWVSRHSQPDTLAICAETPWNLPDSNQAGYRAMGAAYGRSLHDYLRTRKTALRPRLFPVASIASEDLPVDRPEQQSPAPPSARAPFDARQARTVQESWAKHLETAVESTNVLGIKLVLIPPGEFFMGSSDEQVAEAMKFAELLNVDENTRKRIRETERPQTPVAIDRPFLLGATEVTIGQFRTFVAETKYVTEAEQYGNGNASETRPAPATDKNGFDWRNPGYAQIEEDAVSQVSWNDAIAFCNWLSARDKRRPCYTRNAETGWELDPESDGYRLPTEAQWEYACRAGTATQYSFGDDPDQLQKYAWFLLKSGSMPVRRVGSKPANPFGLYDMHGNLFEWCQDLYLPGKYQLQRTKDAPAPAAGSPRVLRGGDWYGNALRCRSAFRGYGAQSTRSDDVGFRVMRQL